MVDRLMLSPDCMVDALKLPSKLPKFLASNMCTCPSGTQSLYCWAFPSVSGQVLTSNSSVLDSTDKNLVFGCIKVTY